MKTKNDPNKRQAAIIECLNKNGKVSTNEIRNLLINDENYGKRISKSTLSEDIKFLISMGYPIVQSYGYISLDKQETDKKIVYHEKLCAAVIRKWIILYNIYDNGIFDESIPYISKERLTDSCVTMYEKLANKPGAMSEIMFYRDLKELEEGDYIEYYDIYSSDIKISQSCGSFRFADIDKDRAAYIYEVVNNEMGIVFFKDLKELLEEYWPEIKKPIRFIKENNNDYRTISQDTLNMFEHLTKLPYNQKCLDITYCCGENNSDTILYKDFEMIDAIFTEDSKRLLLLGKCTINNSSKRNHLLSFEYITDIQESTVENTAYRIVYKISEPKMKNKNPDKEKLRNRYKNAFITEYKEDIDECLSAIN